MDKTKLHVWAISNLGKSRYYPVATPEHAAIVINAIADGELLDSTITDNSFGLVQWDGEEWIEWYSDDGDDIDAFMITVGETN